MPKRRRVCPEVQEYERLVFGLAIKYHQRLPSQFRSWIDTEDLYQAGMLWAWSALNPTGRRVTWEPGRGKFTTFIQTVVSNCMITYLQTMYRSKRLPPGVAVDIDTVTIGCSSRILEQIGSRESFQQLRGAASPELQSFLGNVVIGEPRRLVTHGQRFRRIRREFRQLAREYNVTADDMRVVLGLRM